MATASFLLPSPSARRDRLERLFLNPKYGQSIHVRVSLRCPCKCIYEHRVPLGVNAYLCGLRCFSTKRSLVLCCTASEGSVSVSVFDPENLEGSKMLDKSSIYTDPTNDFEKQLEEFFNEVKNMLEMGNKDGAVDLLQANYEIVNEQIDAGNKTIEQAAILDIIALGYVAVGDLKFVEHLLKMLTEIVDVLNDDERLLDSILIHMGGMYTTLGKFDEAMLVYRRGLEILEHLFGKHSPFLETPLLGMAKVLKLIGSASEAIEIYHRAVSILEVNRGAESEELVIPLFALGNLLIHEGRAADAESLFRRILNIYTKSYGRDDGRVGMAMCSLAHAFCAKGNIDEAIDVYKKGLEVIEDSKYMTLDDGVLVKMRVDLAELLHVAGREREGQELLEECLLIAERCKGSEHPSLVTHILNLATSYSRSKNFVEAERLLRVGMQLMSKSMGPKDHSVTVPMLHLAVVLYNLKRDKEAERITLEVLQIREDAFGRQSLPVGEALDCLISIQARLGKDDDEILAQLKRLLSIQEEQLGYHSEDVLMTLKKIVYYLDKMGRRDEKFPLQRRLSILKTKHRQRVPV